MLVNASHSTAWRSQGYVCLACRRAQASRQKRWNSEYLAPQPSSDSWFDGLNDINDEFSRRKTVRRLHEDGKRKEEEKNAAREQKRTTLQERNIASAKSAASREAPATKMTDLLASLRAVQGKKDESRSGSRDRTPYDPWTGPSELQRVYTNSSRRSRSRPNLAKEKQEAVKASKDSLQEVAESVYTQAEPPEERAGTASFDISQFKGLISTLRSENQPSASEKVVSKTHSANAVTGERRDGHVAATKTSNSSLPVQDTRPEGNVHIHKFASTSKMPLWRTLSPPFEQVLPTTSSPAKESKVSNRPMTLVERHRQHVQDLTPFGLASVRSTTYHASFESLRKADNVSAGMSPASSINDRPFGLSSEPTSIFGVEDSKVAEPASSGESSQPLVENDAPELPLDTIAADTVEADIVATSTEHDAADDSVDEQHPDSLYIDEPSEHINDEPHARLSDLYAHQAAPSDSKDTSKTPQPKPSTSGRLERRKVPKRKETPKASEDTNKSSTGMQSQNAESPTVSGLTIAQAMRQAQKERNARRGYRESPQSPESSDLLTAESTGSSGKDEVPNSEERRPAASATKVSSQATVSISPSEVNIDPLDIPQPHVPFLQYGLDRVLFNPGVYQLQDTASRVYNFDPYLQKIMPVLEFDFDALKQYKTSSQDAALATLAREHGKKYIGSTSSMTSSLAHFHYLISNWRPLNLEMMSKGFLGKTTSDTFTNINRAPSAIFLRWRNGTYAIDADKEYDSANVLMLLGKSMELLLTLPKDDYERYRKSDPRQVSEEQKTDPESYQYTTMGDFLMRSQLDAYDSRLPGNGTFDLKTRAVVSVRMDSQDFESMTGYEITSSQGRWMSYEREYYDMMRSTMLKYMLQARMGRMTGIFVAYHNVKRMFGFQYIPIHEMDRALHGQKETCLGDQEFKASLNMFNELLNRATAKFPEQSLRIHFETRPGDPNNSAGMPNALHCFAEPMSEDEIDAIQNSQKAKIAAWEHETLGKASAEYEGVENSDDSDDSVPLEAEAGNEMEEEISPENDMQEASATSEVSEDAANEATGHGNDITPMMSSDASGDVAWLDQISKEEEDLKPLFHATIVSISKINGEFLDMNTGRPTELKPTDKWEIDYMVTEYDTNRRVWASYEDTKARRNWAFADKVEDEDRGDAESGVKDKSDSYLKLLKQMASRGEEMRERIDELEEGKEISRADQPLPKEREIIEGVDDYTAWLYRKR